MRRVAIGVTTFERPKLLRRTLEAIAALECKADIEVFVADNGFEKQEGVAVAHEMRDAGFPFPITAFAVTDRGITYPRNALVDRVFENLDTDFLAFVDDDQLPEVNWLQALLDVQASYQSDAVGPAVLPMFEDPPPKWAESSSIYRRYSRNTGLVPILDGTGGVLLAKSILNKIKRPWFNNYFALSGGEDFEFFLRLKANGGKFAFATEAIINEYYTEDRVTMSWALKRAYRIGNSSILINLLSQPKWQVVVRQAPKMVVGALLGPVLAALSIWSPGLAFDMLCKSARAYGKFTALLGSRYLEYERIHGN